MSQNNSTKIIFQIILSCRNMIFQFIWYCLFFVFVLFMLLNKCTIIINVTKIKKKNRETVPLKGSHKTKWDRPCIYYDSVKFFIFFLQTKQHIPLSLSSHFLSFFILSVTHLPPCISSHSISPFSFFSSNMTWNSLTYSHFHSLMFINAFFFFSSHSSTSSDFTMWTNRYLFKFFSPQLLPVECGVGCTILPSPSASVAGGGSELLSC